MISKYSICCPSLVPKNGDPSIPTNFRPIAMSSVFGKLFHKILARRIESFSLANKIIDASIQKGFLRGINGVMEHILTVNAILENAKDHNQHLSMTFIDLKNAFGSVPHGLITDM